MLYIWISLVVVSCRDECTLFRDNINKDGCLIFIEVLNV